MYFKQFLLFILLSSFSFSFNFDIWDSGDSLENVILKAKKHNIALLNSSYPFAVKKGFNWKYLKNYKHYNKFKYFTSLMGHDARVLLYFTENKELYKIQIYWSFLYTSSKEFEDILIKTLNKKYGVYLTSKPTSLQKYIKNAIVHYKIWKIDSNNFIVEKRVINTISLNYINKTLLDNNLNNLRFKKKKMIENDSNKF